MALDSTAKISDVVSTLNGVQGLNQKSELVSVINDMGSYENEIKTDMINKINAVSTQNPINLPTNANWYDVASAIPNINTGKRWASGKANVVYNGESFIYYNDTTVNEYNVQVLNIGFKPNIIIIFQKSVNKVVMYNGEGYNASGDIKILYSMIGGSVSRYYKLGGVAYVNESGFRLPVYTMELGGECSWIAFE